MIRWPTGETRALVTVHATRPPGYASVKAAGVEQVAPRVQSHAPTMEHVVILVEPAAARVDGRARAAKVRRSITLVVVH
jgi:hypothetical protein